MASSNTHPPHIQEMLRNRQRDEITEYHIYRKLAEHLSEGNNRRVLMRIAEMEKRHYDTWKQYSGREVPPNRLKIALYTTLARLFGITFALRLMEMGEEKAQEEYRRLADYFPEASQVLQEEMEHEDTLMTLLNEEVLAYLGSVVLGLNDALVELTGALAGLTFALQNGPLIALTGTITGVAAAFSMAVSEYLSTKAEKGERQPIRAAVYTGIAYLLTVMVLIFPFLVLPNPYISLVVSLGLSLGVIAAFSFYRAVVYRESFRANFVEMAVLSLGVAAISFVLGYVLREIFNIEVEV